MLTVWCVAGGGEIESGIVRLKNQTRRAYQAGVRAAGHQHLSQGPGLQHPDCSLQGTESCQTFPRTSLQQQGKL